MRQSSHPVPQRRRTRVGHRTRIKLATIEVDEHRHWHLLSELSPFPLCLNDLANARYRESARRENRREMSRSHGTC